MNSGPMADPTALRRDRDARGFTVLPEEGRPGPPPPWPLIDPNDRELTLWAAEWARPQATMWERNGQQLEVALFVRSVARAEQPDAPLGLLALLRQNVESLGLSAPGMARLRWTIGKVQVDEVDRRPAQRSTRSRFQVVPTGGDDGAAS